MQYDALFQIEIKTASSLLYQCVKVIGRLGNNMFIYASSLGVASIDNRTMVIDQTNPLLRLFALHALINSNKKLCQKPAKKTTHTCCVFKSDLLKPEPKFSELFVGHYLQSWRYFSHVSGEVRSQFTAYGSTRKLAAQILLRSRKEVDLLKRDRITLVGLHVRHGDIARQTLRKFGYQLPPVSYYRRAIKWFLSRYPNTLFLVSSDNQDYAHMYIMTICGKIVSYNNNITSKLPSKQVYFDSAAKYNSNSIFPTHSQVNLSTTPYNKKKSKTGDKTGNVSTYDILEAKNDEKEQSMPFNVVDYNDGDYDRVAPVPGATCRYVGTHDPGLDMIVLANCDHVIMSSGTFGWWAGWLSGGHVVYYKHSARKGSHFGKEFDAKDFFPPSWIPLE